MRTSFYDEDDQLHDLMTLADTNYILYTYHSLGTPCETVSHV
jgi:hypothetical protein